MNIDEIIEKKEKRNKLIKTKIIPIILIVICIIAVNYFLVNKINKDKSDNLYNEPNGIDDKSNLLEASKDNETKNEVQKIGIGNGTNTISYKGDTYLLRYDSENQMYKIIKNTKNDDSILEIIAFKDESGFDRQQFWIYNDNIYFQVNKVLKKCDLNGQNESDLLNVASSGKVNFDCDREQIVFFAQDNTFARILCIAKIDGTILKSVLQNDVDGYFSDFLIGDNNNIFFTTSIEGEGKNIYVNNLYMINKDTLELSKITSEELYDGWYGCGIYQAEKINNYVYYVAGTRDGSGGYFYGSLYKIKEDGTEKTTVSDSGAEGDVLFSENIIPKFEVYNNYLYYEGVRINLETGEKTKDYFANGDVIDGADYEYTASLSNSNKISIVKFKAGTQDMEDMQIVFEKEIPAGATIDSQKVQLKIEDDYLYVTITYTDMDSKAGVKAWMGENYLVETYKMKKDGSDVTVI